MSALTRLPVFTRDSSTRGQHQMPRIAPGTAPGCRTSQMAHADQGSGSLGSTGCSRIMATKSMRSALATIAVILAHEAITALEGVAHAGMVFVAWQGRAATMWLTGIGWECRAPGPAPQGTAPRQSIQAKPSVRLRHYLGTHLPSTGCVHM